ncbi:hypothetical protein GNI_005320 [Gregarina niphandrodes]|uniref:Uncharacterized protein n=1 Tax=Gregarina niphandrodes TaxID=110365 RepID=A0A023BDE3_GRENI|nr:hypothetical protein GNI_005320 [Gregarina niphandrodes]EZG88184.1 hypothetical protein GNI_005320 [Gregarina niphandrodes]|eukprot:XP_011128608.1 hypothetical protein GNI_005320 [Gregarina niphandrodes]
MVGWINSVEIPAEDTWELTFEDGTGSMPVVYQLKTDLGSQYESDLSQIKPDSENVRKPCRIIGIPQVMDSRLYLQAICIKPCSVDELYISHPFNVVQHYLKGCENAAPVCSKNIERQAATGSAALDPFEGEEIIIQDADISDIVGEDRLRRVLWKLLSVEMNKGNKDMYRSALITKCKKWTTAEVNTALEELEEGGVIIYLSGDKQKIALI